MSNIDLIIEERPRDIGNFMVGRLLPFRTKRMVGPFIFIDHMGPALVSGAASFDIGPHPHIGLSTLTYLFEGSMMHRDSLGTEIEIKPGQVNWMTAGRGIVHSERTPDYLRNVERSMHGLQIWVALPKALEEMDPTFYHANEEDLPSWQDGGLAFRLIAGEIGERKSPVPVYSALYFLEIKTTGRQTVKMGDELYGESGLYILSGAIEIEGHRFEPKELLVSKDSGAWEFVMEEGTTVYFFGGEPLPGPRLIYWNFVATEQHLIDRAKQMWRDQTFPRIKGETDFIPLPLEHK